MICSSLNRLFLIARPPWAFIPRRTHISDGSVLGGHVTQKRVGQGLSFLIAYTNSKQLTNLPSFGGQGTAIGYGNLQTNSQINNKALGQLDRPQNLSLSWVYQLPFGPGKRYASTNSPVMKQLVGGWQVAGLQQYTSGDQITVAT